MEVTKFLALISIGGISNSVGISFLDDFAYHYTSGQIIIHFFPLDCYTKEKDNIKITVF